MNVSKVLKLVLIVAGVLLVSGLVFVYAGIFNVAADNPHWNVTYRIMEATRERSIASRARDIEVPALDDPQLLARGAEEYEEMCTGCHLAPGMRDTPLRTGLYPKPPNLAEHAAHRTPAENYWIIKHGLKMSGMPAWGLTHEDASIWAMVALVQRLPELSSDQYRELVEQSGGAHSHGEEEGAGAQGEGGAMRSVAAPVPQPKKPTGESEGHDYSTHSHANAAAGAAEPRTALSPDAAEPAATVEQFFKYLSSGNTAGVSSLLDPKVLIFESGGAERSREEYASHHLGSDAKFLKTVTHKLLSRTGDALGDLAWVASEARLTGTAGSKPVDIVSTETMVLRKTRSGWRIVHIHWSNRANKS